MRVLVKPIDLKTATSLVCSYRLPDMFADKAKKQRNIVRAIMVLKTLFKMREILLLSF